MWWIFITGKNFHQRDEFSSWWRISIWIEPVYFNGDTMNNPSLQLSISITMIIIHNDYEVLSWLIIFITTNDFHQKWIFIKKWIFFTLMNFNHNVFFFITMDDFRRNDGLFSLCQFFIAMKNFHHRETISSQCWYSITMMNVHHNDKFSSQCCIFLT